MVTALEYSVVKGAPHFVECMVVALALQVTPLVLVCESVIMEEILALRDLFKATMVSPNPQVPLSFLLLREQKDFLLAGQFPP